MLGIDDNQRTTAVGFTEWPEVGECGLLCALAESYPIVMNGTHSAPVILRICLPPSSMNPAWLRVGLGKDLFS